MRRMIRFEALAAGLVAMALSTQAQAQGLGIGLGGGAGATPAAGPTSSGYSGTTSGGIAGFGPGVGLMANPYTNPYVNPNAAGLYGNALPGGGIGAAWMVMGMRQQAQAQSIAARNSGNGRNRGDGLTVPRGAMMRPGGGASRYFGGGAAGEPDEDQTSNPGLRSGYFSRHDRFFRPNG